MNKHFPVDGLAATGKLKHKLRPKSGQPQTTKGVGQIRRVL